MVKKKLLEKLNLIVKPVVEELKYELYYIDYVKIDGENYLQIFIDKEGGISLKDCEQVSRPVSAKLDEYDPIEEAYYLEVSSPGIERILYTDEHIKKYSGNKVEIKLNSSLNGAKKITGIVQELNEENIILISELDEKKEVIPRDKIDMINLKGEF